MPSPSIVRDRRIRFDLVGCGRIANTRIAARDGVRVDLPLVF